jgi:hypothetical protein
MYIWQADITAQAAVIELRTVFLNLYYKIPANLIIPSQSKIWLTFSSFRDTSK